VAALRASLYEFWVFGLKQANACIFAGVFLGLVILTSVWYPPGWLARYDFLFLAALAIQAALLALRWERPAEFQVIVLFHLLATAMELFKTALGSWSYPEPALLRIGGVPLFAGFMYSAVGSYIARIWRIFAMRVTALPGARALLLLSAAIYANFFTHHYLPDARWLILLLIAYALRRSTVHFTVTTRSRRMPLLLGLTLVALFVWLAENIATFCRVWCYPNQLQAWTPVSPAKLIAWFLLMFISFSLIAVLHQREQEGATTSAQESGS
jgi:uncharacterized membrane protein YoaT (DUF817 family)